MCGHSDRVLRANSPSPQRQAQRQAGTMRSLLRPPTKPAKVSVSDSCSTTFLACVAVPTTN